tara:strand:+ start:2740 stop:2925 length:186 start_codon:yes stop_codon:yes gene_type:complete
MEFGRDSFGKYTPQKIKEIIEYIATIILCLKEINVTEPAKMPTKINDKNKKKAVTKNCSIN